MFFDARYKIFLRLSSLVNDGLGQGAQPILSFNFGAKNAERVKKTFKLLLCCTLCCSMLVWTLVMLLPQFFAKIFSPDSNLIEYTAWALRIYCAAMGVFGIQIACQLTFTSIGKATESIIVAVMRKFILLLPLIYLLPHFTQNQAMGVYLAEPVADFISVTFTAVLFDFRFRKEIKKNSDGYLIFCF